MHLDTTATAVLLATWMVTFHLDGALTSSSFSSSSDDGDGERPATDGDPPTTGTGHDQTEKEDSSLLRDKRDGYGGGSSYSSGGSYGCNCPYQYCDNQSDLLLYFSAGALLGLLFSLLQGNMMMMPTPPPPMMGRSNVDGEATKSPPSSNTAAHLLNSLPTLLTTDIAPLAMDIMKVYTDSEKHPECIRRWICELTQKSMKQGGFRARITSVTSVAMSWMLKDMMPFLENMDSTDHFDCSILAHECKKAFDRPPVTYN